MFPLADRLPVPCLGRCVVSAGDLSELMFKFVVLRADSCSVAIFRVRGAAMSCDDREKTGKLQHFCGNGIDLCAYLRKLVMGAARTFVCITRMSDGRVWYGSGLMRK